MIDADQNQHTHIHISYISQSLSSSTAQYEFVDQSCLFGVVVDTTIHAFPLSTAFNGDGHSTQHSK